MACPYFDPGERLPGSSGSLGDLYTGLCRADAGSAWLPDQQTVQDRCNLGYARGHCAHFPMAHGPDAVRFSVSKHEDTAIRILYSLECDHRPFSNGAIEYSTLAGAFTGSFPDGSLENLAAAYVRSYLRRLPQRDKK
jgi:hypothetical protein